MDYSKYRNLKDRLKDEGPSLEDTPTVRNEQFIRTQMYDDPAKYDEREAAERVKEEDAKKVADLQLKEGFTPIVPLKEGFKPIGQIKLKEGFKPITAQPSSLAKEEPIEAGSIFEDLMRKGKGTAVQAVDLLGQALTFVPSWVEGLEDQIHGRPKAEGGQAAEQFKKDYRLSEALKKVGIDPGETNPAIDKMVEAFSILVDEGLMQQTGLNQMVHPEVAPDGGNPLAQTIITDTSGAIPSAKGGKMVRDNFIEASSRRIPDEPLALPPTEKPVGAAAAIQEQGAFRKQQEVIRQERSATDLAEYNQNPSKFGVDESGTINPYIPRPIAEDIELATSEDIKEAKTEGTSTVFKSNRPEIIKGYVETIMREGDNGSYTPLLEYIAKYSDDPFERAVAGALVDPESTTVYRKLDSPEYAIPKRTILDWLLNRPRARPVAALTRNKLDDPNVVESRIDFESGNLDGISSRKLIHEGMHDRLYVLYEMGRDARTAKKYPDLANFHNGVADLWIALKKDWPEHIKSFFHIELDSQNITEPGHELISYAMENGNFAKILKDTYVGPTKGGKRAVYAPDAQVDLIRQQAIGNRPLTAWQKFGDLVLDGLGLSKYTTRENRVALRNRVLDFIEIRAHNRTAFEELTDLVFPILNATRGIKFPSEDREVAFETYGNEVIQSVHNSMGATRFSGGNNPPKIKALPQKVKEVLDRMVSPFKSYNEMVQKMGPIMYDTKKFPDLDKPTGLVYPATEVKNVAGVPLVTFTVTKTREINGAAHLLEKLLVQSIAKFTKSPVSEKNKIVQALAALNRPEIQEVLRAERGKQFGEDWMKNPDAFKLTPTELTHYGIAKNSELLYRQTLEPLFQTLLNIDKLTMKIGFGRDMTSDVVGYFPRNFGYGKFSITVFNTDGAMVYFRRAPTLVEIQKHALDIQRNFPTYTIHREVNKDYSEFKGHLMALDIIDPNSAASKVGQATIKAAEEHRRSQEFERSTNNVAGWVGQNLNDPKEVQLLIQSIFHRIQQTIEAYKAARLISEVIRPIQADPLIRMSHPNAFHWSLDLVRRELGGDISEFGFLDRGIQWILDQTHKTYLQKLTKYADDIKPGEPTLNPTAAKELMRYTTASSSAWLLLGNIPNAAVNAMSIPLVSLLGGFPDATLFRKDPASAIYHATKAHVQSIADAGLLLSGLAPRELADFMKEATDRGHVMANAYADIPELRSQIEKSPVHRATDTVLNIPRKYFNDLIEIVTNFTALLYYRRLIKNLMPQLTPEQHFKTVVELAKRYTGEYSRWNKAQIYDKMGVVGQGVSNFHTWIGTRLGQFHELMNETQKVHFKPLLTLLVATTIAAGIQGVPLMQDYENVRQAAARNDFHALPPMDLVMKENDVPEWLRNGVAMNMFGVDIASRGKWAGFTDAGGVTYMMPGKAWDIYKYIYNHVEETYPREGLQKGQGNTIKDDAAFVRALPTIAQGYARQELMTRKFRGEDEMNVLSTHGNPVYQQKPEDKTVNLLNFKTVEQAEAQRNFYNTLYRDNKQKTQIKETKQKAVELLVKMIDADLKGDKERALRLQTAAVTNLKNLAAMSTTSLDNLAKDLEEGIVKETDTQFESQLKELARTKNAYRALHIVNNIRLSGKLPSSPSTSQ